MRYAAGKVVSFAATLFIISLITFTALQVLPGDPALLILGTEGDPEAVEALRNRLGLDDPVPIRYGRWMLGLLQGDMGESLRYNMSASELILRALPISLMLAGAAVGLSLCAALPLGVLCATFRGRSIDLFGLTFAQFGMAIPSFWLGILLIQVFAVRLHLAPPGGYEGITSLVLPAVALALPRAAILTRMVRASMLDVLHQDYVRTARSKGVSLWAVVFKHALRNAGINIFTVAGIHLTQLLAGTIVIEQVFALPGLGQLLLPAVLQRDLPLVQGLVMIGASLILMANLGFDFILAALDPRIRFD